MTLASQGRAVCIAARAGAGEVHASQTFVHLVPSCRPLALAAFAAALVGCAPFDHMYGTATIAWTLDGRADPSLCAGTSGTSWVHVVVRDESGGLAADSLVSCRALSVRYVLERGWYTATVSLVSDAQRYGTREIGFAVYRHTDAYVTVDLPLRKAPTTPEPLSRRTT